MASFSHAKVISVLGVGLLLFAMLAGSAWARNLGTTNIGSSISDETSSNDEEVTVALALVGIPQDLIIKTSSDINRNCIPKGGQCYRGTGLPCCNGYICKQGAGSFMLFCGG